MLGCSSVVKHLPRICKGFSSTPAPQEEKGVEVHAFILSIRFCFWQVFLDAT